MAADRRRRPDCGWPADPRRREVLALLAGALASGCSQPLRQAPADVDVSLPAPPVVVIHGTFGSRLRRRDSGQEVWPGRVGRLLLDDYHGLARPLDPETARPVDDGLEAYAVFDQAAGMQFYGSVLQMLKRAGRYVPTRPGTPARPGERRQYVYVFDWRRDYAEVAVGIDGLIEQIRADHGDRSLKVDIVAHSSGGLMARYFLLYGATPLADAGPLRPDFAGVPKVRRLVTLGTPDLGMARAAAALVAGEPIGMRRMPPEVLTTAYSCLQLLPHGCDAWLTDTSGRPLDCDPFDVETWRDAHACLYDGLVAHRVIAVGGGGRQGRAYLELQRRGFAVGLRRARRFLDALWAAPPSAGVPRSVIAGDCRPTLARLVRSVFGGNPVLTGLPLEMPAPQAGVDYEALMFEPGDGMVSRASALATPSWPVSPQAERLPRADFDAISLVCAQHNQLVVNPQSQREILRGLGQRQPDLRPAGR